MEGINFLFLDVDNSDLELLNEEDVDTVDLNDNIEDNEEEDVDIDIDDDDYVEENIDLDTEENDDDSSSSNPYTSIAKDLSEQGVLINIDESTVDSPESLLEAIQKTVESRLDERLKRIEQAINNGVTPDELSNYENAISYLDSIDESLLKEESELAMELRTRLISQDLINRGYSEARIQREVKKSIDTGNDIDDALEALKSNKDYFNNGYLSVIEERRVAKEAHELKLKKQANEIKETILNTETVFDGIKIDLVTRKKAFDNIYKPIYTDPDSGAKLTAIQKYEKENKKEFMHNMAIIFTMTDGFKNLDKFIGLKVNNKTKKVVTSIERAINNTSRKDNGNIDFMAGLDGSSYDGLELDVN